MDTAAILVTGGGAALAAFILWFFLAPGRERGLRWGYLDSDRPGDVPEARTLPPEPPEETGR